MDKLLSYKDFLIIFLILLFSFAIFGLQPWGGNNVLYLPFMEKLQNSNLFSRDILFESLELHPSFFYKLMVFISNLFSVSLKNLFNFLCFINFFSIALVSFLICQNLFKNKLISFLFLIFLMGSKYSLASEAIGINLQQATQTSFVLPLALLAILYFLENKRKFSFLFLGLIANIQLEICLQLIFLFTFGQLFEAIKTKKYKANIKKILCQCFFCFLTSLPILLVIFKNGVISQNWLTDSSVWLETVKLRISHHFLPTKWSLFSWLIASFFLFLFREGYLVKVKNKDIKQKDVAVINLMFAFLPIFLLVFIFSEVFPVKIIMMLEIFRVFVFFNFFCLLYASYYVYHLLTNKKIYPRLVGLFLACFLFLPTSIFYNFGFLKPSFLGPFTLFIILSFWLIICHKFKIFPNIIKNISFLFLIIFFIAASFQRLYKNYKNWNYLTFDNSSSKEWQDVQLWVNKNTTVDSLFISPPHLYGFRVYSQRPVVGEFKDGASLIFHPTLFKEWWQRMVDLGVNKEMAKGAFLENYIETRDEKVYLALFSKYKADYLISSYYDLPFLKLYNNNKFSVYKIR